MTKAQHHIKVVKYLSIDCICPTCVEEPEKPCHACSEACLTCQDQHDPEWRGFVDGREEERNRLIKLLMDNNVLRRDGLVEAYVYVDCNTMEVKYLKDKLVEGTSK